MYAINTYKTMIIYGATNTVLIHNKCVQSRTK